MPRPQRRPLSPRGIARAAALLLIIALFALVPLGIWATNRFFWFGAHPAPANYAAQYQQHAQQQTSADPTSPDSWPLYEQVASLIIDVEEAITGQDPRRADGQVAFTTNYSALLDPATEDHRQQALLAVDQLAGRGLFELLDQLAAAPTAIRPPGASGKLHVEPRSDLGAARQLARILFHRYATAWVAGDEQQALRAQRHLHALTRHIGAQPTIIERLIAIAIATGALEQIRDGFRTRPPSAQAAESLLQVWSTPALPSLAHTLEGERLVALDAIDGLLQDTRFKPVSRGAQMEKINEFYSLAIAYVQQPPGARDPDLAQRLNSFDQDLGSSYLLIEMFIPAMSRFIQADTQHHALTNGTLTLLAIELHIAHHGAPPQILDDLTPALLPTLPPDPFSNTGFIYRPDPSAPRGYILYSVGFDAEDNNGKPAPQRDSDALTDRAPASDYIFVGPAHR